MTTLSGTVTAHGHPAANAVVEVHNEAGDTVDQVQVDAEGRYTYHLSPGRWSIKVWDPHGHRGEGEIAIDEGDDATLDIDLHEPEGGH